MIYAFNSITMILITINGIFMVWGACNYRARVISGCLCSILGCVDLAAIIVMFVFRFNTIGRLAALSEAASYYDGASFMESYEKKVMIINSLSTKRTYTEDGRLIMISLILQIGFCLSHCCIMGYVAKPPSNASSSQMADKLTLGGGNDKDTSREYGLANNTSGTNESDSLTKSHGTEQYYQAYNSVQ